LYYKDYGLLLTETHVLRQIAKRVLPSQIYREFLIEVNELTDIKAGVARQKSVISRMRWSYSKWF
jgi:nuclear-control-of-ATPase protein 2